MFEDSISQLKHAPPAAIAFTSQPAGNPDSRPVVTGDILQGKAFL
jgi:hypothetical protein